MCQSDNFKNLHSHMSEKLRSNRFPIGNNNLKWGSFSVHVNFIHFSFHEDSLPSLSNFTQILLLDEPTAGMDPCSRHIVWNLLKYRKCNRVTVFSTHFMDEADILAGEIFTFLLKDKVMRPNGRLDVETSIFF